jgi:hypothetical protein
MGKADMPLDNARSSACACVRRSGCLTVALRQVDPSGRPAVVGSEGVGTAPAWSTDGQEYHTVGILALHQLSNNYCSRYNTAKISISYVRTICRAGSALDRKTSFGAVIKTRYLAHPHRAAQEPGTGLAQVEVGVFTAVGDGPVWT